MKCTMKLGMSTLDVREIDEANRVRQYKDSSAWCVWVGVSVRQRVSVNVFLCP